jgi:hypothetical protein
MNRKLSIFSIFIGLSLIAAVSAMAANNHTAEEIIFGNSMNQGHSNQCGNLENLPDRADAALRKACGRLGSIYVSPLAGGRVLDLLRMDFNVVSLDAAKSPPFYLGPMVITAPELDDPAVAKLVTETYEAGRTVAVAPATVVEANRFSSFLGAGDKASCTADTSGKPIALFGLQKSITRQPGLISSYCVRALGKPYRKTDDSVRRWLIARFGLSPPEPVGGQVQDSSSVNLNQLSIQTLCHFVDTDDPSGTYHRQIQLDSYVLSVRSFDNNQDLYLVNNNLLFYQEKAPNPVYDFEIQRLGSTGVQNLDASIDFVEPASQSVTTSYTNSQSTTVSGSVGFNETQGFNASASASVTVGTSSTVTVPAMLISNQTLLSPPYPKWIFELTGSNYTDDTSTPQASWVWTVDKSAYGSDGGEGNTGTISFVATVAMGGDFVAQPLCNLAHYPFPAWTVTDPVISSLSATSVSRSTNNVFYIYGTQLYPNLVTDVLIGGNALGTAYYTPESDTSIKVTVPSTQSTGKGQIVQVKTTFNGQELDSNTDMTIDITQ